MKLDIPYILMDQGKDCNTNKIKNKLCNSANNRLTNKQCISSQTLTLHHYHHHHTQYVLLNAHIRLMMAYYTLIKGDKIAANETLSLRKLLANTKEHIIPDNLIFKKTISITYHIPQSQELKASLHLHLVYSFYR